MGKSNIAFITSAHSAYDDRIYYHLADTLSQQHNVIIISSEKDKEDSGSSIPVTTFDGSKLSKKDKINVFVKHLNSFSPDIIIASEPLPVIAADRYKKSIKNTVKILYDVTEWYPSPRNTEDVSGINKVFLFFKMIVFNLYASFLCDGFIFGEHYKSFPSRILFPFKKWKIISYYTDLKYIAFKEKTEINNTICLCCSGRISAEKGIVNFINVIKTVRRLRPEQKIKLKIIGWFKNSTDQNEYNELLKGLEGVEIDFSGKKEFKDLSLPLQEADVFFDLRELTFENKYSLPIKLFYYAACGRPVIYTDIKAIRKAAADIEQFGFLVNPSDSESIATRILQYIDNPLLYQQHCFFARKLAEEKYNWNRIKPDLIYFVR